MTVKEIAALAGVSRGTVDRVLHNRPGVSRENYERITKIMEEHHFRPNTLARALSRKQVPKTIGVIINSKGNPFFDDVIEGVQQCCDDRASYDLSLSMKLLKGYDPHNQLAAIDSLIQQKIDGLIITAVNHPDVQEKLLTLKQSGLPIITLNTDVQEERARTDYIGCDYYESGRLAGGVLELLSFQGALRVGIVQGSKDIRGHVQRLEGFREIAEAIEGITVAWEVSCQDDDETAYHQTMAMLDSDKPDLIYVVASGTAGVLRAIEETGGQVSAITNDLLPVTKKYLQKGIIKATIYQQPFEQGYNAVGRMIDCLYGLDDMDPAHYQIRLEIITRYHREGVSL